MFKNIILLGLLSWMSLSHAEVTRETIQDAHAFKVEKPVDEMDAQRSVAGEKIKKQKKSAPGAVFKDTPSDSESDSEVRYWKYSEE